MKLYSANLSPFAARVRIQIYAKGLPVEIAAPPGELKSPEYLAINPLGKIPCLEGDGMRLPESGVIADYLEDRFPSPALLPENAEQRARARLLARLCDLYLYAPLRVLFGNVDPASRNTEASNAALADIDQALGWVSTYLDGDPYAVGSALSLADCALAPTLFFVNSTGRALGRQDPFAAAPAVGAYFRAVRENEHVRRVLDEMQAALRERMAQARG